ncbi:hypothetical protein G6F31_019376 [Rhizopus arrhizus]|nr:hypothetical protein G6F31_019376 [Rhizopus arrhizus]
MPTPAKRLAMVAVDSSIAMMPLPGATMAWAVSASCSMLMYFLWRVREKRKYSPATRCLDVEARMETIPMSAQDRR